MGLVADQLASDGALELVWRLRSGQFDMFLQGDGTAAEVDTDPFLFLVEV